MSRQLAAPGTLSRIEFVFPDQQASWASDVANRIYDSRRSYRNDHCAIFIDEDSTYDFLNASELQVDILSPDENWHWTGVQRHKKLKSVLVADYGEWFRWFMKWQRFNAFQIVVLIAPFGRMIDSERRGYIDGLLTRLLAKPSIHKTIVVEEESFQPLARKWLAAEGQPGEVIDLKAKFGPRQASEAIVSLLFGTHLSKQGLHLAAASTLFSKLNENWEHELEDNIRRPALVDTMSRWLYTAGYYGREMVEALETEEVAQSRENPEEPPKPVFRQSKEKGPSELGQDYLEVLVQNLLDLQGWFTIQNLFDYVNAETQKVLQTSDSVPKIFNDHFDYEKPAELHVFLPSRPALRGIAEGLARDGKLQKTTWVKEIGRPATVYHMPGKLPFDQASKCGQCAFYVSARRQCRIWWLLNKSYSHRHDRWTRDGPHPLSSFDLHKMRNSWRIGPHSTACLEFVDKKRDYTRKTLPESCDICYEEMPETPPKGGMVVCGNCRTRYFTLRQKKVKVLTSYEHEFKRRYEALAGVDPSSDLKRLIEERQGSAPSIVERAIYDEHRTPETDENPAEAPKTVMIFPGDRMLSRDGKLYIFKKRKVESIPLAGSTLIDLGGIVGEEQTDILASAGMTVRALPKPAGPMIEAKPVDRFDIAPFVEDIVRSQPEFIRGMALAMAQSAINATGRVASLARLEGSHVQASIARQKAVMRRLERVPPSRFLAHEALVMKEYWGTYHLALNSVLQRSGPRKKARFVREYVTTPTGRARGYTAMDAAINYLHQRRLFKARSVNVQLGLDPDPGEGFLHRKRWNPEGLGLNLDLIDPFKFADREKLLEAVLDFSVNWRDFYSSTDRHGARFYYPRPEVVGVLETVGEAADGVVVSRGEREITLMEAYKDTVQTLVKNLKARTSHSFKPFEYAVALH